MSFLVNIAILVAFVVVASIALVLIFLPVEPLEQPPVEPPIVPPVEPPIEPLPESPIESSVEPPVQPPEEPPEEPVNICPSTQKKIAECESLFEERMNNIELIFNLKNQRRPFSGYTPTDSLPSFSADPARQAYSGFIQIYKSCGSDVKAKHAALLQRLGAIDKDLDFVNWNSSDLKKIVCVEVNE